MRKRIAVLAVALADCALFRALWAVWDGDGDSGCLGRGPYKVPSQIFSSCLRSAMATASARLAAPSFTKSLLVYSLIV